MNNHEVHIVTSLREYEDEEQYLGCDGIFATDKAARRQIAEDVAELLEQYPDATYLEGENRISLADGSHRFVWQIDVGYLPDELFQS